jgi:predicted membrane channel-forming protein YqfA (hemolysin III family)
MPTPDQPSPRKLVAIALILLLILIWAGLVATLSPWVSRLPVLVQAAFYLAMGIGWIAPLKPLIRWSQTGTWRKGNGGDR